MNTAQLPTGSIVKLMQDLGRIEKYQDKWINCDVVLELLHHHYNTTNENISTKKINSIYGSSGYNIINKTTEINHFNLYRERHDLTKSNNNNQCTNKFWYYFSNSSKLPPKFNNQSTIKIQKKEDVIVPITRATTAKLPTNLLSPPPPIITPTKRNRDGTSVSKPEDNLEAEATKVIFDNQTSKRPKIPDSIVMNAMKATIFNAPETLKTFGGKGERDDNVSDARDLIHKQIKILRKGWLTAEGWREVIDDGDMYNRMTPLDIFSLQTKCKYLSIFLKLCIQNYDRKKRT